MKAFFCSLFLLSALPCVALASDASSPFNTGYLHIGLGPSQFDSHYQLHHAMRRGPLFSTFPTQTSRPTNTNNLLVELGGGYSHAWLDRYYLGMQSDLDFTDAKNDTQLSSAGSISSLSQALMKLYSLAFSIKLEPGIVLHHDALLYTMLGWQISQGRLIVDSGDAGASANVQANNSRLLNGIMFGAGMRQFISSNLALDLTYERIDYNSIHINQDGDLAGITENHLTATQQVELNNYLFGIDYYFNHQHHAYTQFSDHRAFSGFYLGMALGAYQSSASIKSNYTNSLGAITAVLQNVESSGGQLAGMSRLFGGYAFNFNRFNLGIGAFVDGMLLHRIQATAAAGNNSTSAQPNLSTTVKLSSLSYGVDLRPGIIINNNALFYLHGGVAFNDATVSNQVAVRRITPATNNVVNSSVSKVLAGVEAGMGLQERIAPRTLLDLGYTYTYYGSLSTPPAVGSQGASTASIDANSTRISTQSVTLGVLHYFSA